MMREVGLRFTVNNNNHDDEANEWYLGLVAASMAGRNSGEGQRWKRGSQSEACTAGPFVSTAQWSDSLNAGETRSGKQLVTNFDTEFIA
eukprot:985164-Pelagomonas_calceolata.AAC.5